MRKLIEFLLTFVPNISIKIVSFTQNDRKTKNSSILSMILPFLIKKSQKSNLDD